MLLPEGRERRGDLVVVGLPELPDPRADVDARPLRVDIFAGESPRGTQAGSEASRVQGAVVGGPIEIDDVA